MKIIVYFYLGLAEKNRRLSDSKTQHLLSILLGYACGTLALSERLAVIIRI